MNAKQKEWVETYFEIENLHDYPAFMIWFNEQLDNETEACANLAVEVGDVEGHTDCCCERIAKSIRQRKYARA